MTGVSIYLEVLLKVFLKNSTGKNIELNRFRQWLSFGLLRSKIHRVLAEYFPFEKIKSTKSAPPPGRIPKVPRPRRFRTVSIFSATTIVVIWAVVRVSRDRELVAIGMGEHISTMRLDSSIV